MTLWERVTAELIDLIEWLDESSDTLVWRFPRYENEIKQGARLIVRQAQQAVFVHQGRIADVFGPGSHTLKTGNLPVLSTLAGWKYGFDSPFRSEVYFVNTRNFTNLKWGTRNPVIVADPEFGPVRLRAYGSYVLRVSDPIKFMNEIVGSSGHFTVGEVSEQLRNLIITRFSDHLGQSGIPVVSLAANYDDFSAFVTGKIAPEFEEYGLSLTKFLVESISLPPEVQQALDKRSSMGIIGNLDDYLKFESAAALQNAAINPGGTASAGVGIGMGFAMASQLSSTLGQQPKAQEPVQPPPLPQQGARYYVGRNGKKAGPFDAEAIAGYIRKGAITDETLMWKEGMVAWEPMEKFDEFRKLRQGPPPLPE